MPVYTLTAGMVSDTYLDQHSTPYTFGNGSLAGMSCDITAETDGMTAAGVPYTPNGPVNQDIVDIGSTMTVDGVQYNITGEIGSYSTIHYDNGSGPQDANGFVSHYTLENGTDTIYVSFAVLETGSPLTVDSSVELLGFTFDDDLNSGNDLGLMPEYDDQGNIEWGAPDGIKVPCFTSGMMIETEHGPIKVDDIKPGTMVKTFDNGLQEVKFTASRKVLAMGELRPVVFEKGAIGNTERMVVSPKHRFYVAGLPENWRVRFGTFQERLIQAIELCNGTTIRQTSDMEHVEYFHLMFDEHQLLHCHGTVSESWQPTRAALKHQPELAEELMSIFPGIEHRIDADAGALARMEITINKKRAEHVRSWRKAS